MTVEEADALRTLIKTMLRQNYSEYVYRIYAEVTSRHLKIHLPGRRGYK